jgi:hypothetical protein
MTEKEIKVEQWYVYELINKIKKGDITKPKFQRKRKWDTLPKRETKPNEHNYIIFLYDTHNSVHAITLGENIHIGNVGRQTYTNIDGNNRINAIWHFMERPFDIFPEHLDKLYEFIDSKKFPLDIKELIKSIFVSLSYDDIMNFKYNKFFIENGEKELYTNHLQILRDAFDDIIEDLQLKLKINKNYRFDTVVKITVNIFNGYTTEELAKIFEDINKFNSKLSEIELLACRLHGINNFEIKDNIIRAAITDTLVNFYEKKADGEVLTCYQFNKDESLNAYDFIVGFQDYCSKQSNFIEETDNEGASLFFKLYKILYNGYVFTTENINDFISKINKAIVLLNKINTTIFTDNINEKLFNKTCVNKLSTLKKNNVFIIISAIIGFFNKNEKESVIINAIEKCLLYHFFSQDVSDKDKQKEFQLADMLTNAAAGAFIDGMADKIHKAPENICDKITKINMSALIKQLNCESNCPHERYLPNSKNKNDKRRPRKFYEKTLAFYYFKQNIPTNLLSYKFSVEHLFPNSSIWDEKMDKDRFGNIIPIIHDINISRGNGHISKYIELDKYGFTKNITNMIPSIETYNSIISHSDQKPKIISVDKYNEFCEENETRYLDNFINRLYPDPE